MFWDDSDKVFFWGYYSRDGCFLVLEVRRLKLRCGLVGFFLGFWGVFFFRFF